MDAKNFEEGNLQKEFIAMDVGDSKKDTSVLLLTNMSTLQVTKAVILDKETVKTTEDVVNILEFIIEKMNLSVPEGFSIAGIEKIEQYLKK